MACCPPGSEPLRAATHVPRGTVSTLGDLPIYHVGEGSKAVVVCYEVFGWDTGRNKFISDQLAEAGFNVVLPDFYRNAPFVGNDWSQFPAWTQKTPWSNVKADLEERIIPFLKSKGAKTFGILGFCWGNWVVFHANAEIKEFQAGASAHPSVLNISKFLGENVADIVNAIKTPQLVLNAGNDAPELKDGGVYAEHLKKIEGSEIKEYSNMQHGWVTRGDLSDPAVAEAVKDSTEKIHHFFHNKL